MPIRNVLLGLVVGALFVSCGSSDVARTKIKLPALKRELTSTSSRRAFTEPPSLVSGFDCYAVNVMGENIPESGASPNRAPLGAIVGDESKCSYAGKMSALIPISEGGEVELSVPRGPNRVIQILGVISPQGCQSAAQLKDHFASAPSAVADPQYPGVYELGRTVINLIDDTSVTIENEYDPTEENPLDVRCGKVNVDCRLSVNTAATPTGAGTEASPYRICTAAQLNYLTTKSAAVSTLETNLDLTDVVVSPLFNPAAPLDGTFDGQGFTLSRFISNTSGSTIGGLFGFIGGGTVKRLNLTGTLGGISSGAKGLLAGVSGGTIEDVHVAGEVNSSGTDAGGLIGSLYNGSISKSSADVAVSVVGSRSNIGGLVGRMARGLIERSFSKGNVNAPNGFNVGGFLGHLEIASVAEAKVRRSYSTGNVIGGNIVGGFIGRFANTSGDGDVSNCYETGSVEARNENGEAGGFVGMTIAGVTVDRVYSSTASVLATGASANVTGFQASGPTAEVTNAYSNSAVVKLGANSNAATELTLAALKTQSSFLNFDFNTIWDINDGVSTPTLR